MKFKCVPRPKNREKRPHKLAHSLLDLLPAPLTVNLIVRRLSSLTGSPTASQFFVRMGGRNVHCCSGVSVNY